MCLARDELKVLLVELKICVVFVARNLLVVYLNTLYALFVVLLQVLLLVIEFYLRKSSLFLIFLHQ